MVPRIKRLTWNVCAAFRSDKIFNIDKLPRVQTMGSERIDQARMNEIGAGQIWLYIFFYVLGILISISIIVFWFFTGLPLHLTRIVTLNRVNNKFTDWADWLNWVRMKSPLLAELFGCPICFGFWISLLVASIIVVVNSVSAWFIPSAALSWPAIIFVAFKILSK